VNERVSRSVEGGGRGEGYSDRYKVFVQVQRYVTYRQMRGKGLESEFSLYNLRIEFKLFISFKFV
jgi:hypothetical protein